MFNINLTYAKKILTNANFFSYDIYFKFIINPPSQNLLADLFLSIIKTLS